MFSGVACQKVSICAKDPEACPPSGDGGVLLTKRQFASTLVNNDAVWVGSPMWIGTGLFRLEKPPQKALTIASYQAPGKWSFYHPTDSSQSLTLQANTPAPLLVASADIDGSGQITIVTAEKDNAAMEAAFFVKTYKVLQDQFTKLEGTNSKSGTPKLLVAGAGTTPKLDGGQQKTQGFLGWTIGGDFFFVGYAPPPSLASVAVKISTTSTPITSMLAHDMDGDGPLDPILIEQQQISAYLTGTPPEKFVSLFSPAPPADRIDHAEIVKTPTGARLGVVLGAAPRFSVELLQQQGASFKSEQTLPLPEKVGPPWRFTDLDGDGTLELLAVEQPQPGMARLTLFILDPKQAKQATVTVTDNMGEHDLPLKDPAKALITAANLDADPDLELLIAADGQLLILNPQSTKM